MATFKVGQRVKRVANCAYRIPIGATGTISAYPSNHPASTTDLDIDVRWDASGLEELGVAIYTLAPITDPDVSADAFIERVKSWKPEPAPIALPESVNARGGVSKEGT